MGCILGVDVTSSGEDWLFMWSVLCAVLQLEPSGSWGWLEVPEGCGNSGGTEKGQVQTVLWPQTQAPGWLWNALCFIVVLMIGVGWSGLYFPDDVIFHLPTLSESQVIDTANLRENQFCVLIKTIVHLHSPFPPYIVYIVPQILYMKVFFLTPSLPRVLSLCIPLYSSHL